MTTATTPKILWTGKSGKQYEYLIYPLNTTFKDVPGNYIWARRNADGRYRPLYNGEAEKLGQRVNKNHEKWACVTGKGATHVMAHETAGSRQNRLDEETDIREQWKPDCSDQ